MCHTSDGVKLLDKSVFKVSALIRLHTRADGCATVWLPYE